VCDVHAMIMSAATFGHGSRLSCMWKGCENLTTVVELLFLRVSAALSVIESTFDLCDRSWGRECHSTTTGMMMAK
jgi:hypothetical protein